MPRLRMFAGPNGSGKSTIKGLVEEQVGQAVNFGHYINPDEIAARVGIDGFFDFATYDLIPDPNEVLTFFESSSFLQSRGLEHLVRTLSVDGNKLKFSTLSSHAYIVSVLCDFLRHELLKSQQTFTFETVMSEAGKVEFLRLAQAQGYRTYLYYVATSDPAINVARVRSRVEKGGHNVPADKISSRYYRSLDLLWPAIQATNRSFIFDNSFERASLIAETEGDEIVLHGEETLQWLDTYVLEKAWPGDI